MRKIDTSSDVVAWHAIDEIGKSGVTDRADIAQAWLDMGLKVSSLVERLTPPPSQGMVGTAPVENNSGKRG